VQGVTATALHNGSGGGRAVILAGGKGTRLGPFTTILPKPLLPIGDRAILELVIEQLRACGFTRLTLAVGHLSHLIEAVFGDGSSHGVQIEYHHERLPLGTAGALAGIQRLDEPFLMINGDVITTLDFRDLLETHVSSGNALTIATQVRTATIDFGVLHLAPGEGPVQQVVGYHEKPRSEHVVSMGVYILSPHLLDMIQPDAYLDFPDLVLQALAAKEQVGAYDYGGLWLDIGRHEDYERAISASPDLPTVLKEAARAHAAAARP
jgi:NDP-sugar pyrophosphorylase family protein